MEARRRRLGLSALQVSTVSAGNVKSTQLPVFDPWSLQGFRVSAYCKLADEWCCQNACEHVFADRVSFVNAV